MRLPDRNFMGGRTTTSLIAVVVMVLAFISSRFGISFTDALAFWSIVLALTSVIALIGVILFYH